MLKSRKI